MELYQLRSFVTVAEDDITMKSLLIAGAGLGIMEESEALEEARKGNVALWPQERIRVDLSFIYLKKREDDPLIEAIIKVLKEIWKRS